MAGKKKSSDRSSDLRQRAEKMLVRQGGEPDKMPPADVRRMFHELQVNQIELELQNDELRRTQQELETSREKYFDLYDLAPVGYITLNEKGTISESNLTAAALLGKGRSDLVSQPLTRFIFREDQSIYYLHHKRLLETRRLQECEVRMMKGDGTLFWARMETVVARGNNGEPALRTTISDITEPKKVQEVLKKAHDELELSVEERTKKLSFLNDELKTEIDVRERAEERTRHLASFPEMNPNPIIEIDSSGKVIFCNKSALNTLKSLGMDKADIATFLPLDIDAILREWDKSSETTLHSEVIIKDRIFREVIQLVPQFGVARIYATDITDAKKDRLERETTVEFLRLVNESRNTLELVQASTTFFHKKTGVEAVGIRLREEHDYPYYETQGFPDEFVRAESKLCTCDKDGRPILDSAGAPALDCMCGNVICGRFDPSKPFFTELGNFWTNSTTKMLANTTEKDRQARTRNRCHGEGYESVALIGLSLGDERLGLLQLNDRRTDCFTPQSIALWERLANYLAVALAKFRADEELQKSEERLALAASATQIGMFDWNLTKNRILWTQTHEAIFGYGPATTTTTTTTTTEHDYRRWSDRVHPEDLLRIEEESRCCMRDRKPLDVQYRIIWPDGSLHWVETKGVFLYDSYVTANRMIGVVTDITERKKADEAVSRSQKTFYELVERAPFGIYVVDSQFRIAQMNVGSQNGAFRNVRPVIGRDFAEAMRILWPEPVAAEIVAVFCHTLDTGEPYYSPRFINPRHDIETVESYEWELHRMMLPDGQYGVICYYFDSTNLREAEEALRESERRERERAEELAAILDAVPTPVIIVHDPEATHMTGNGAADELLRQPHGAEVSLSAPPEVKPSHFMAIKDNRELRLDELPAQRAAGGEYVRDFEFSLVFDDGTTHHLLGYGTPLLDKQGRPRGAVHVLVDITDRKRAEEEIKTLLTTVEQDKAQLKTLFETMTEGFSLDEIILDEAGKPVDLRYLSVNPAFERHTGLKAKDIEGRTCRELFPDAEPVWFERYGKVALSGEPTHFQEQFGPLNRWFQVSSYQTEPGRFATVFFDITERKRAEEEIKRLNSNLLKRNEELESANKEMESFVYSISHDLRAPLRHISGFTDLLMKTAAGKLDKKENRYFSNVLSGSEKMSRLIDDLLNLSRISKQEIKRREVNMSAIAASIIAKLREAYPGKSIEVDIREGIPAFADLGLIEIVLSNLLGNAWKFTSKKEQARIEFGTMEQDGKINYYVRDNGAGFNQEYAGKMFWPFHRLHSEEEFEGTGIGLAIVDRIIRCHEGKVWAEGIKGEGATIYFSLP